MNINVTVYIYTCRLTRFFLLQSCTVKVYLKPRRRVWVRRRCPSKQTCLQYICIVACAIKIEINPGVDTTYSSSCAPLAHPCIHAYYRLRTVLYSTVLYSTVLYETSTTLKHIQDSFTKHLSTASFLVRNGRQPSFARLLLLVMYTRSLYRSQKVGTHRTRVGKCEEWWYRF